MIVEKFNVYKGTGFSLLPNLSMQRYFENILIFVCQIVQLLKSESYQVSCSPLKAISVADKHKHKLAYADAV